MPSSASPPAEPERAPSHRRLPRLVAGGLALVLAFHLLVTFVFNSGSSPLENTLGSATVDTYMQPMFAQSWSVFAPNPTSADESLQLRAQLPRGSTGKPRYTPWFNLTDHDIAKSIRYHPVPSRLYLTHFILLEQASRDFSDLNQRGRRIVGQPRSGPQWPRQLQQALRGSGTLADAATDYVRYDQALAGLATGIAVVKWGRIKAVQVRITSVKVPGYDDRKKPSASRPSSYLQLGQRPPTGLSELDRGALRSYLGSAAKS